MVSANHASSNSALQMITTLDSDKPRGSKEADHLSWENLCWSR